MITRDIYNKIPKDKYEIARWNENLIPMKMFLSFLTIDYDLIKEHLGSDMGWSKYENKKYDLIIKGGLFNGVEYLHTLQFKNKLSNDYNNYVNPLFLFEILTIKGRAFFLEYYKHEIDEVINEQSNKIQQAENKVKRLRSEVNEILKCFSDLRIKAF